MIVAKKNGMMFGYVINLEKMLLGKMLFFSNTRDIHFLKKKEKS